MCATRTTMRQGEQKTERTSTTKGRVIDEKG